MNCGLSISRNGPTCSRGGNSRVARATVGGSNEMRTITNRGARITGIITTLIILTIGAAIPTWVSFYVGEHETSGRLTPLWTAVRRFPDSLRIPDKGLWE